MRTSARNTITLTQDNQWPFLVRSTGTIILDTAVEVNSDGLTFTVMFGDIEDITLAASIENMQLTTYIIWLLLANPAYKVNISKARRIRCRHFFSNAAAAAADVSSSTYTVYVCMYVCRLAASEDHSSALGLSSQLPPILQTVTSKCRCDLTVCRRRRTHKHRSAEGKTYAEIKL